MAKKFILVVAFTLSLLTAGGCTHSQSGNTLVGAGVGALGGGLIGSAAGTGGAIVGGTVGAVAGGAVGRQYGS